MTRTPAGNATAAGLPQATDPRRQFRDLLDAEARLSRPIEVQLGIFGGSNAIAAMHTVAAHTRVLPDGSEVFVGEHLRWNRGRQAPRPRAPRVPTAPTEDHPSLFHAAAPGPASPRDLAAPTQPPPIDPRQLRLW